MILLDEVIGDDNYSLTAEVTITRDSVFLRSDGVPGHVGVEYMAQACGAFAGVHALDSGQPVRIGLLLGTRNYRVLVARNSETGIGLNSQGQCVHPFIRISLGRCLSHCYRPLVPHFRLGDRLRIAAAMIFRVEPVAAFACGIIIAGKIVAEVELKVYEANDERLLIDPGGEQ
jgi:ApeP dehydratase